MITLKDLEALCNPDRLFYQHPFVLDGKTAASDGYVLVLLDELLPGTKESDFNEKAIIKMQSYLNHPLGEELAFEFKKSELIITRCPACIGKKSNCPECEGEGFVDLSSDHNEYRVLCASCKGSGCIDQCDICGDTGFINPNKIIKLSDGSLTASIVSKVADLPNPKLYRPFEDEDKKMQIWPFSFDGGHGVIAGFSTVEGE